MCVYMGGCQNYGPFLGAINIRCRIIIGTQEWTIILTATHIYIYIEIEVCVQASGEHPHGCGGGG